MSVVASSGYNKRLKILIVDDDASAIDLVADALGKLDFEIVSSRNVADALSLLAIHGPRIALVISDFNMPEQSGFDLRKAMFPAFVEVPFVLLSGFVSREEALKAIDLKISQFVEKPFQLKELRDAVIKQSEFRVAALREDDELLFGFIEESRNLVEEMESIIIGFESGQTDPDSINRLFACAHTIKGSSGYFKPDTTTKFTHKFEDFIVQFRGSGTPVDRESASVMMMAIDVLRELLSALEEFKKPRELDTLLKLFVRTKTSAKQPSPDLRAGVASTKAEVKLDELKISVALLDSFMERSGELTVLRNMVNKSLNLIEAKYALDPNVVSLASLLAEMHKTNSLMQDQMTELRKVSLRHVIKPLSRTVRDLASQLKKKMKLETMGDELRVDHSVADVLSKCLIHIIRNSADHGLEGADERVACGKDPVGTITVSSEQLNDNYLVCVADDGRGINVERVIKKAIENGLASQTEIETLSRSQILEFIFRPGFSTAAAVTDVSGRGVGTDMVKRTVEAIGGKIHIESETGRGSRFVLSLPVPKSVLIVDSLLVQVSDQVFAIPQSSVRRVVRVEIDDQTKIHKLKDEDYFCEAGEVVPIVELSLLLNLPRVTCERQVSRQIVWVEGTGGSLALDVDHIFDVEDTVVKKVAPWFNKLDVYSGATFLADGRAGLVLDIEGIFKKATRDQKKQPATKRPNQSVALESEMIDTVDVLIFDTGTSTLYGVEQTELFRLEEFSSAQFQDVSSGLAILYRNAPLPLMLINGEHFKTSSRENWPVVVVEKSERLYGFVVNNIVGFSSWSKTSQNKFSALSTVSIEGRAVQMVSLRQVIEKIQYPKREIA